jgi:uncharacterized membrane protein YhhN
MKNQASSAIYFLTGLTCIILLNQSGFWPGFIVKAFIIPVLIILLLLNIKPLTNRLHRFMFAGLFFSWTGDIFLEFSKDNSGMFILGLGAFLLAHVMYFTVFILTPGKNTILNKRIWLLIPVIIYGAALVSYLYNDLANMKIPVIIYATVILAMLSGAINRKEKVIKKSYYLVLAGAILFLISDSMIAIAKFSHQFNSSGILIMSTYIVAQYLIVTGYIHQFRKNGTNQIT